MTDINKQKFLTELGKLLTFMYEEDRQLALSIYEEVFEQAEDEQAVLSALVSPTRQAVIIARAYNAKERKLQINSQSREDGEYYEETGDVPDFVKAIEDAVPFELAPVPAPVSEDQLSLFEEGADNQSDAEPAEGDNVSAESENSEEAVVEEEEVFQDETPEEGVSEEEEVPAEEAVSEEETQTEEPAAEENAEESDAPAEEDTEETGDEESTEDTEEDASQEDETDAFIKDFEIKPASNEPDANEETEETVEAETEEVLYTETVSKPRVFLLILYILFAVPIGAAGIVLLLVPTLLFLALAVAVIAAGSVLLAATFSGFAVFADLMVMLGSALIVLALGLLFLWIFIWFIGGAMASLVRGILDLAHKWCYKEVPAV